MLAAMNRWMITFLLLAGLLPVCLPATSRAPAPDFDELRALVRAHLPGLTEAELNRAAVDGLLHGLRGRVLLVTNTSQPLPDSNAPVILGAQILEERALWVRVGRVAEGLAPALRAGLAEAQRTNRLAGLILDLRFAGGDDYAAAAAVADLFQSAERPLLDWGAGVARSTPKSDAVRLPVTVLVNRETSGAAEALAAVLRDTGTALLVGWRTAGLALVHREFTLRDGQRVRLAVETVKFGRGAALPPEGIKPDIEVAVGLDRERRFQQDPYAEPDGAARGLGTNSVTNAPGGSARGPRRLSEADLVRERREGRLPEAGDEPGAPESAPPRVVQDPVLARALDFLKGLDVLRPAGR